MHEYWYAGIGSRNTPVPILNKMRLLAGELAAQGWRLRSGGARGADAAFLAGAPAGTRAIMTPWPGYRPAVPDGADPLRPDEVHVAQSLPRWEDMMKEAARHHPAWHRCGRGARALHARNAAVVRGPDLADPVTAVVCWTPDGRDSGGTGEAIRIARARRIPVWNLKSNTYEEVRQALIRRMERTRAA